MSRRIFVQCFLIPAAVQTSRAGGCNIGFNTKASDVGGGEGARNEGNRTLKAGDVDDTDVVRGASVKVQQFMQPDNNEKATDNAKKSNEQILMIADYHIKQVRAQQKVCRLCTAVAIKSSSQQKNNKSLQHGVYVCCRLRPKCGHASLQQYAAGRDFLFLSLECL